MENLGPIRSSQVSMSSRDLAAPSDELISVALWICESQEENANKSLHASGRQRRFLRQSQTRLLCELRR
jgi:hypothetical protein